MRKTTFILILMLLSCQSLLADTSSTVVSVGESTQMTLSEIIGYGLPVLYIETIDGAEPTCEQVYAPAGSWGSTINSQKAYGRMLMYKRINGMDSMLYDSGEYEKNVSGMTIKVRGNTSAMNGDKKPYKIKLQKKFDLMMRGVDSVYKDKEWALLKDEDLYTFSGFSVARQVGMTWVPGRNYVNVIMNDIYRGVYLLTEQVKRNPDCRLNVDKNCGFIFECDIYWWNEDVYVTSCDAPGYNYTFKYPEEEDITEEQLAYMQSLVNTYEASLNNGTYPDYIDVRSFAAWCLVHDLMGTKDGGGCNRYYTKYDTTAQTKIVMPVAWDFDMSMRISDGWSRCHTVYMKKLFNSSNKTFVNEYVRLWCLIRDSYVNDIKSTFALFTNSAEGIGLQSSYNLDNIAWNRTLYFQNIATARRQWLLRRFNGLDADILSLRVPHDVNVDGVVNITDVTTLINMLLGGYPQMITGDIDEDGNINISDVTTLINMILQGAA